MKKEIVLEIISFLFIVLFVYAAVTKLTDYDKFRIQIGQSPLITAYSKEIVWFIPLTEIAISLMLVIPKLRLVGLYAAFTLMVIFTGYIVAITQFSEYIPCSCGGVLEKLGWTEHLIFNIGFVLLGFTGIMLYAGQQDKKILIA